MPPGLRLVPGKMLEISELKLPVDHEEADLEKAVEGVLGCRPSLLRLYRRAVDARHGKVLLNLMMHAEVPDEAAALAHFARQEAGGVRIEPVPYRSYHELDAVKPGPDSDGTRPVVIGTGPCGLFCALLLARHGRRPIVLERGKAAGPRARDVTGFWRRGVEFNPDSNVQFGEGGAGTFSDGKLYTQIRDREHRIRWLLEEMVKAGAPEDILVKARPHIGTDRLIKVVRHVREEIIALGGEVRFETMAEALLLDADHAVRGVRLRGGEEIPARQVVLAVGHSARETFTMLHSLGVHMEAKPISIGVRVEHPQDLIDRTQYGKWAGHKLLGAAPYKFVHHAKRSGRAAYSFCMCPGGLVVAAASEPGGVVTNGMSSYARAEANANAGFMVDVQPEDYMKETGIRTPLAGMEFQRKWEQLAFRTGGGGFIAPAQTIGDFLARRASTALGNVKPSYEPGVLPADLRACLPPYVVSTLHEAIPAIERLLRGFALPDGILTGVETRSSSPLRITRDPASLESVNTPGLFPAGEGAGYAGGIISAAADGMRIAEVLLSAHSGLKGTKMSPP